MSHNDDIKLFKKNPNRLLKKLRVAVNKNLRDILTNQKDTIIYPVPKKFLPSQTLLRELYNQAYYCHYISFSDASLSLSCICLEKISRDFYKKFISENSDEVSWNQILEQLRKYFKANNKEKLKENFLIWIEDVIHIKDNTRNLLLHGKIEKFIKSSLIEHEALNVYTLQKEKIRLTYSEEIHGTKKGEIKQQKTSQISHTTLTLLSITIILFNKYIDLKPLYR